MCDNVVAIFPDLGLNNLSKSWVKNTVRECPVTLWHLNFITDDMGDTLGEVCRRENKKSRSNPIRIGLNCGYDLLKVGGRKSICPFTMGYLAEVVSGCKSLLSWREVGISADCYKDLIYVCWNSKHALIDWNIDTSHL